MNLGHMVNDLYSEHAAIEICAYLQDFDDILNLCINLWRSRHAAARCRGAVFASRLGSGHPRQDTFDPELIRTVLNKICEALDRASKSYRERQHNGLTKKKFLNQMSLRMLQRRRVFPISRLLRRKRMMT